MQLERGQGGLRLAVPSHSGASGANHTSVAGGGDWYDALDRVREAAATLRAADERIRELEARYEEIMQFTIEQLKAAQKKLDAASERALAAVDRAKAADERSAADRQWLLQIQAGLEGLPQHAQGLCDVLGGLSFDDDLTEASLRARQYG